VAIFTPVVKKAPAVKNIAALEAWAQAFVRELPCVIEVTALGGSRADAAIPFEGERRPVDAVNDPSRTSSPGLRLLGRDGRAAARLVWVSLVDAHDWHYC
jgi:hypothetical protein